MKRPGILLITLLLPAVLIAQKYPTGQGTLRTGGGMNISEADNVSGKSYRIVINPTVGYFVWDEVLLGLNLNYVAQISEPLTFDNITLKISPLFRYYFKLNKTLFVVGEFYYTVDRETDFHPRYKDIVDNSSFSFGPGVDYFLSRRIGVEAIFDYTYYLHPDETHHSKLNFNVGFNIHLPPVKVREKDKLREKNNAGPTPGAGHNQNE